MYDISSSQVYTLLNNCNQCAMMSVFVYFVCFVFCHEDIATLINKKSKRIAKSLKGSNQATIWLIYLKTTTRVDAANKPIIVWANDNISARPSIAVH